MRKITALLSTLMALLAALPANAERYRDRSVPMASVAALDLNRYLGKWYEIARFPNRFEKGCVGVTAEYSLRTDGDIRVLNTCRKGALDGPVEQADGSARLEGPGQLSVTFVPWLPFARGDYWVLYVSPGYDLAVVGAPKGTTGWILARTPEISAQKRQVAEGILTKNGYDINKLEDVLQK
ncbi:MAG: lipocalin family protein [Planktotalea sp.]|uniref:lipocalin family protein n=1 Tax=Planktotalea sp. TaxID=2029877 RepID=UPI003C746ED8